MKTKIFLSFLIFSVLAFSQTSKFTKYFQYTNGSPMTGVTIELLPEGNTYPTGAVELTEHSTRLGYYYSLNVPHGNYDIYIDGTLYETAMWVGDQSVSNAANKFDPNGKLFGSSIEDETIKGQHLGDTTITDRNIKEDAITSYKILDETIQMVDLNPDVINAIVGGITPVADTGKVNTTGSDNLYANYWFHGTLTGYPTSIFDFRYANRVMLPLAPPSVYAIGSSWFTDNLRAIMIRSSNGNDTIPSLYRLRELGYLPYTGSDSGKVNTSGTDYTWGNYTHYGPNYFNGGLRIPLSGYLNKAGEIWFNPVTLKFFGRLEDEANEVQIITENDLDNYPGSSTITTLGTVTTGTWNATTIAVNKGGTGATNSTSALTNLLPSQTGNSGKALLTNGATAYWGIVSAGASSIANYEVVFQGSYQTEISLGSYTAYKIVVVNVTVAQGGNILETISNGVEYQRVLLIADYDAQDALVVNQNGNIRLLNNDEVVLDGNKSIELMYFPDEGYWKELGFIRSDLYVPVGGGVVSGQVYSSQITLDGLTPTANWSASNNFHIDLTDEAVDVSFSNLSNGKTATISVTNTQKEADEINFPNDVTWVGGIKPTHPAGKDVTAIYKFERTNGITIGYLVQTSTSSAVTTRLLSVSSKNLGNLTINTSHTDNITLTALYADVTVDSIKTSPNIALTEAESFTVEVGTPFVLDFTVDTSAVGNYDSEYLVFYTNASDVQQDSVVIAYNVVENISLGITATVNFGTASVEATGSITIVNPGSSTVSITGYDSLASPFSLVTGGLGLPSQIGAQSSLEINLKFFSVVDGSFTDTLWIFHAGVNNPSSIIISGTWINIVDETLTPWSNLGPGGGGFERAVRYDPTNPLIVYSCGDLSGINKSTDGGHTWTVMNNGIHNIRTEDIAHHPDSTGVVLIAGQGGIFKTTNGGVSWTWKGGDFVTPTAEGNTNINSLTHVVYHAEHPNLVYATSGYMHDNTGAIDRFWKSTNYGETWDTTASDGLPGSADGEYPSKICRYYQPFGDPNNTNIIYVCTNDGFYKSTDGGNNFVKKSSQKSYKGVVDPANSNNVYFTVRYQPIGYSTDGGGIWKSTDAGETWSQSNIVAKTSNSTWNSITTFNEIKFNPSNTAELFVCADQFSQKPPIFKSTNGGSTWTHLGKSYWDNNQSTLLGWGSDEGGAWSFDVIGNSIVFTPEEFYSVDGGNTWNNGFTDKQVDGSFIGRGQDLLCVKRIKIDPLNSNNIYMGVMDNGIVYSKNKGESWFVAEPKIYTEDGVLCYSGEALAIDPTETNIIYAGLGDNSTDRGVIIKSTNAGTSWFKLPQSGFDEYKPYDICILPGGTPSTRTMLMSVSNKGIYRSTNSGTTWTFITSLGTPLPYRGTFSYSDSNSNYVYYTPWGKQRVSRSTDAGLTWTSPTISFMARDVDVKPGTASTIYVSATGTEGGLYRSTDFGLTFTKIFDDDTCSLGFLIQPNPQVYDCVVTNDGTLYVGGQHGDYNSPIWYGLGVYKSTNDGSSWTKLDGMINQNVEVMEYDNATGLLYVGTGGGGLQIYNPNVSEPVAPEILSFNVAEDSETRTADITLSYSNNSATVAAYYFAGSDTANWQDNLTAMNTLSNSADYTLTGLSTSKYYVRCKVVNSAGYDISTLDSIDFPEAIVYDSLYAYPGQSSDDSYYTDAGYHAQTDTVLYMGDVSTTNRHSAIRFINITIPSGATIDSATITLQSPQSTSNSPVNLKIYGEDVASPNTFASDAHTRDAVLTDSSTTLSSVSSYTSMQTYSYYVTGIVKELKASYSYSNGSMVFYIKDNGSADNASRRARAYDKGVGIPTLKIYYHY